MAAQLLMAGIGFDNGPQSEALARAGIGGLKLYGTVQPGTSATIRTTIGQITAQARIALVVAVDEEGGPVHTLGSLLGPLPSPRHMAEQWTTAEVRATVASYARGLRDIGITMDLAPDEDVAPSGAPDLEGQRSFSENPEVAAAYSTAFAQGLTDGGVVPVAKHFPGLGHANDDTEHAPAAVPTMATLEQGDLIPFRETLGATIDAVMVGHQTVPGLTDGLPATLAPGTYRYLRQRLGFTGLVIADAVNMGAVTASGFDTAAAAEKAIEAGADMVVFTDYGSFSKIVSRLVDAIARGRLPRARIQQALDHIAATKDLTAVRCLLPAPVGS